GRSYWNSNGVHEKSEVVDEVVWAYESSIANIMDEFVPNESLSMVFVDAACLFLRYPDSSGSHQHQGLTLDQPAAYGLGDESSKRVREDENGKRANGVGTEM
ncbi:hypothetical protein M8C21_020481, partial [Ambrosia artemisiifolia]